MFIKIHQPNDTELRINTRYIESYITINEITYGESASNFYGMTAIIPAGMSENQAPIVATESVEEIDEMIGLSH